MPNFNINPDHEGSFSNLFTASIQFADPNRVDAFSSLYTMMRVVDELSDRLVENPDLPQSHKDTVRDEIKRWFERVDTCYHKSRDTSKLDLSILRAVAMFRIPRGMWKAFFDAISTPLSLNGFTDCEELKNYAEAAAVIPLTLFLIIGLSEKKAEGYLLEDHEKVSEAARRIGISSFILHVLSVLKTFLTEKNPPRNLLPNDVMTEFNVSFDLLVECAAKNKNPGKVVNMTKYLVDVAENIGSDGFHYLRTVCPNLPVDRCKAISIPMALYTEVGKKIKARDYRLFLPVSVWKPTYRADLIGRIDRCTSTEEMIFW